MADQNLNLPNRGDIDWAHDGDGADVQEENILNLLEPHVDGVDIPFPEIPPEFGNIEELVAVLTNNDDEHHGHNRNFLQLLLQLPRRAQAGPGVEPRVGNQVPALHQLAAQQMAGQGVRDERAAQAEVQQIHHQQLDLEGATRRLFVLMSYLIRSRQALAAARIRANIAHGHSRLVARQMAHRLFISRMYRRLLFGTVTLSSYFAVPRTALRHLGELVREEITGENSPFRSLTARNEHRARLPFAGINDNPFNSSTMLSRLFRIEGDGTTGCISTEASSSTDSIPSTSKATPYDSKGHHGRSMSSPYTDRLNAMDFNTPAAETDHRNPTDTPNNEDQLLDQSLAIDATAGFRSDVTEDDCSDVTIDDNSDDHSAPELQQELDEAEAFARRYEPSYHLLDLPRLILRPASLILRERNIAVDENSGTTTTSITYIVASDDEGNVEARTLYFTENDISDEPIDATEPTREFHDRPSIRPDSPAKDDDCPEAVASDEDEDIAILSDDDDAANEYTLNSCIVVSHHDIDFTEIFNETVDYRRYSTNGQRELHKASTSKELSESVYKDQLIFPAYVAPNDGSTSNNTVDEVVKVGRQPSPNCSVHEGNISRGITAVCPGADPSEAHAIGDQSSNVGLVFTLGSDIPPSTSKGESLRHVCNAAEGVPEDTNSTNCPVSNDAGSCQDLNSKEDAVNGANKTGASSSNDSSSNDSDISISIIVAESVKTSDNNTDNVKNVQSRMKPGPTESSVKRDATPEPKNDISRHKYDGPSTSKVTSSGIVDDMAIPGTSRDTRIAGFYPAVNTSGVASRRSAEITHSSATDRNARSGTNQQLRPYRPAGMSCHYQDLIQNSRIDTPANRLVPTLCIMTPSGHLYLTESEGRVRSATDFQRLNDIRIASGSAGVALGNTSNYTVANPQREASRQDRKRNNKKGRSNPSRLDQPEIALSTVTYTTTEEHTDEENKTAQARRDSITEHTTGSNHCVASTSASEDVEEEECGPSTSSLRRTVAGNNEHAQVLDDEMDVIIDRSSHQSSQSISSNHSDVYLLRHLNSCIVCSSSHSAGALPLASNFGCSDSQLLTELKQKLPPDVVLELNRSSPHFVPLQICSSGELPSNEVSRILEGGRAASVDLAAGPSGTSPSGRRNPIGQILQNTQSVFAEGPRSNPNLPVRPPAVRQPSSIHPLPSSSSESSDDDDIRVHHTGSHGGGGVDLFVLRIVQGLWEGDDDDLLLLDEEDPELQDLAAVRGLRSPQELSPNLRDHRLVEMRTNDQSVSTSAGGKLQEQSKSDGALSPKIKRPSPGDANKPALARRGSYS